MSIIFGMQRTDRSRVEERELRELARATKKHAVDGTFMLAKETVGMGFQPNHTHSRSRLESQPASDDAGNIIVFDGRLDNPGELRFRLSLPQEEIADSEIALAAFERWKEDCFAHFVGDWALALWSDSDQSLYLARDHAGTRTLYYEVVHGSIRWSSCLDTFFVDQRSRRLCRDYAVRYLTCEPLGVLTPYEGITAVPAAHYVLIRGNHQVARAHWQPLIPERIRYQDERDYDEHFRTVLTNAVRRRTGAQDRLIAELSGGMDSTSIVCISDRLRIEEGKGSDGLIDTISYFDDAEPAWDELPYFSTTELLRGKVGIHFKMSSTDRSFLPVSAAAGAPLLPGGDASTADREAAFDQILTRGGYRAVISGIGGDEILGGLPDPRPELADALFEANLSTFVSRAFEWALVLREPLILTMKGAVSYALAAYINRRATREVPPWLTGDIGNRSLAIQHPSSLVSHRACARPSSIGNSIAWCFVLDSLPSGVASGASRREYRYPMLDRDLVEFMFKIPRDQIQRPGRRRHLQRRALAGVVPQKVLERRRKAFKQYGSLLAIQKGRDRIAALFTSPALKRYGFINSRKIHEAVDLIASGATPQWRRALLRAIDLELWLTNTPTIT